MNNNGNNETKDTAGKTSEKTMAELVEAARRKLAEEQKTAEQPASQTDDEKQPAAEQPAEQSAAQPEGEEKPAEQPVAEQPAAEQPAAEQPAEEEEPENAGKVRGFLQKSKKPTRRDGAAPATLREQEEGIRGHSMRRYYGAMQSRKRRPKNSGFLKKMLIYAAIFCLLAVLCTVAAWRLVKTGNRNTAEQQIRTLVQTGTAEDWQQYLRANYTAYAPAYSRASDVAYKVLSPAFSVGKVTYYADTVDGHSVYALFSDGRHFADVTFRPDDGFLSRNETVEKVAFDLSFFETVHFPAVSVYVPQGAALTVNGVAVGEDSPAVQVSSAVYPGVSPGERVGTVLSTRYDFDCLYYVPELTATLDGQALELHADEQSGTYWFAYPETLTHSITVTVPAEVDAYVGESLLSETWAKKELIDGELGSLDDGGTGTLPKLAVWTVDGLFGETDVRAEMDGTALSLLSSENHAYVFDTPAECTYTLTLLYPAGCTVKVNGKDLPASAVTENAKVEDFAAGGTALGAFDLRGVASAAGTAPAFVKTTLTGYLAKPIAEVTSGGVLLTPVTEISDRYRVRIEYDIASSAVAAPEASGSALAFFGQYADCICDGGTEDNPANRQRLDRNHDSLMAMAVDGTGAYFRLMDAYMDIRTVHGYVSHTLLDTAVTEVYAYSSDCLVMTLSGKALCSDAPLPDPAQEEEEWEEDEADDEPEEDAAPGTTEEILPDAELALKMQVLCVKDAAGWHVYDYRVLK